MGHRAISAAVIALTASTALFVVNGRAQSQNPTSNTPKPASNPKPAAKARPSAATSVRAFINDLTIANLAEVQLGRTASERATSPEVKAFGQTMINEHTQANSELGQIAKQLNITAPRQMDRKHMDLWARLSKLSGAEFDREYMKAMAEGHEEVLAKLKAFAGGTADSPIGTSGSKRTNTAQRGSEALTEWVNKAVPEVEKHLNRAKEIQAKVG
nr:protein of unknown function (DUF4142) [uncultured bacterium]